MTYVVLFISVLKRLVNMRWELCWKPNVTRKKVENKVPGHMQLSSGETNTSSANRIVFSMGFWLPCCAS